jgi:hypothetical protein
MVVEARHTPVALTAVFRCVWHLDLANAAREQTINLAPVDVDAWVLEAEYKPNDHHYYRERYQKDTKQ